MYILLCCTIITTIILYFISYKKINVISEIKDEVVSPILEKIGGNESVAKEIFKFLNNKTTTVEENKDKNIKSSFYNHSNNKIVIKQTEDVKECSRVIHIAHECVHSIQPTKLLKAHFIISNIQILYFLGIFIYFFYNNDTNLRFNLLLIQIFILFINFFMKVVLESEATYRAVDVAISYLGQKVEIEKLNNFKKKVEEKLYKMVPFSYFSHYMQGAILVIIAQIGAILI